MASFKVIIVGGSVAGLATALHLEKLGIDWVLIERRPLIAPQLGASLTLQPNGLSVLSQLGCLDDILGRSQKLDKAVAKNAAGKVLSSFELGSRLQARVGYDVYITERRSLVKTLYEHIQDKERIITGQKVTSLKQTDDQVTIWTDQGTIFAADIVVGADGIHSTIRSAMWKMAERESSLSNLFGVDPAKPILTPFGCIYGISRMVHSLGPGEVHQIHSKGRLLGVFTGPEDVLYWFLIFAYTTPFHGLDLPRHTEEDEARAVEGASTIVLDSKTTFQDLYDGKTMSFMAPLPQGTFKRWHYKRIICIGDSAHKLNPLTGQGGCMALESAIALVDSIDATIKANPQPGPLSLEQVDQALQRATAARWERINFTIKDSINAIRLGTWRSVVLEFIDRHVLWLLPVWVVVYLMTISCINNYVSNTLPKPTAMSLGARSKGKVDSEGLGKEE